METWDKLNSGDLKDKIKSGYLIIGPNSVDGQLWRWGAPTEKEAIDLATSFAKNTGSCYEIYKDEFIGVVRICEFPTEFVPSKKD